MWRPLANTENFRRTREKPPVPICCWAITGLNIKLIITIWPLLHLGLYVIIQIGPLLRLESKCYRGWDVYDTWVQFFWIASFEGSAIEDYDGGGGGGKIVVRRREYKG